MRYYWLYGLVGTLSALPVLLYVAGSFPESLTIWPDAYGIHCLGAFGYTVINALIIRLASGLTGRAEFRFYAVLGVWAVAGLTAHELMQYFEPGRYVQFGDATAQIIGVGCGLGFLWWEDGRHHRRRLTPAAAV